MQVALDPYMLRRLEIGEVVRIAGELGYDAVELSPREDFLPFFVHPRADSQRIRELRAACASTGVALASLLPLYRWSSPDESERAAAVRYWRRAIEIAVELECPVMNSEFNGRPENAHASEASFWKSMDELLPLIERENIMLHLEAHPDDFVEDSNVAVDMIRGIGSSHIRYLYCAPHTFHLGDNVAEMIKYAAPVLAHVHVADTYDHRASSGLRYIVNPPGSPARVHQHLDIGQGEVDWDSLFSSLAEIAFDGIITSCVFAWEERAVDSSRFMRTEIQSYLDRYF